MATKMIQIRHVPEEIHATLKARAAKAGISLSEYLISELKRIARIPTPDELAERIRQRTPVDTDLSPADIIREYRDRA